MKKNIYRNLYIKQMSTHHFLNRGWSLYGPETRTKDPPLRNGMNIEANVVLDRCQPKVPLRLM